MRALVAPRFEYVRRTRPWLSDSLGRGSVMLAPGNYRVVPGSDGPCVGASLPRDPIFEGLRLAIEARKAAPTRALTVIVVRDSRASSCVSIHVRRVPQCGQQRCFLSTFSVAATRSPVIGCSASVPMSRLPGARGLQVFMVVLASPERERAR
jgi:hypothetical protein